MADRRTLLVRISGRDRPGITAGLLAALSGGDIEIYDMEQVVVRQRLTLDVLISVPSGDHILKDLLFYGWEHELQLDFEVVEDHPTPRSKIQWAVTVMAPRLTPAALHAVTEAIAAHGGNIDRIVRLSRYPVVSFEFIVQGGDGDGMRAALVAAGGVHQVDIALQPEGLERRAKRLVVLDVDSTLIEDELIELLAAEAGCLDEVRALTERAMHGELDFEQALRERVRMLAGLSVDAVTSVADRVRLTPGARTFVRTLRRLGFRIGIVSGGFTLLTDRLAEELGLDHAYANELAVAGGRLTGELVGPIVDRARKAELLSDIAAAEEIPLEQTVAVGDGANDLDMLARAGLGIAFNAKPVVREAADTAVSVPYLDAVLFVLGIRRDEVEAADADGSAEPVPVPGTPPL